MINGESMKIDIFSHKCIRNIVCILLISLFFAAGLFSAAPAFSQKPLLLGVHPFLPFKAIEQKFTPLAEYLSRKIGHPVILRVGSSYQEHLDAIGRDQLDIAYIGPAAYVEMVAKYGQKSLLACQETEGSTFFTGIIVTRSEQKAKSLAELPIGEFAFVDSHSTMGYLIPRIMLLHDNPGFITGHYYQFLKTHENVALGVLAGDFIAGAVKEAVYQKFKKRGLKALAVTPPIAEHLLVARSDLNHGLLKALRSALLDLKNIPAEVSILTSLKPSLTGFSAVRDQDYNSLRLLLAEPGTGGGER